MIVRQLKEKQFESLRRYLAEAAHGTPREAGCTVSMTIDGARYDVKVQPERHNKIAVLQALRIRRGGRGPAFELITQGSLLSSFLEILIYQQARE